MQRIPSDFILASTLLSFYIGIRKVLNPSLPWYGMFCISVRGFLTHDSILVLWIRISISVYDLCHTLIQFYHSFVRYNALAHGALLTGIRCSFYFLCSDKIFFIPWSHFEFTDWCYDYRLWFVSFVDSILSSNGSLQHTGVWWIYPAVYGVFGVFSVCKAVPLMLFYFFRIKFPLPDWAHHSPY